jgi:cyclase
MATNVRVISRLDIKGPNVVKPVQTEALRVVGNPKELAERYYRAGIDEIFYLDIVASLYQRSIDFAMLKEVCKSLFVPVTVGGRIRSIEDIQNVLASGGDKVAINTHAVHHPEFLTDAVREFGSQCIVLSIEAMKKSDGKWEAYTDGGREKTGVDAIEWAKKAIALGVGEILLTSIDREGTKKGYDIELIRAVTAFASVPVVAHGGACDPESVYEAIAEGKADAVSASSIFHYDVCTVQSVKEYLSAHGVCVRPTS